MSAWRTLDLFHQRSIERSVSCCFYTLATQGAIRLADWTRTCDGFDEDFLIFALLVGEDGAQDAAERAFLGDASQFDRGSC